MDFPTPHMWFVTTQAVWNLAVTLHIILIQDSTNRSRIFSQLCLLQLRNLSRMKSFISLGEVQKLLNIFISPLLGDGSSLHSCLSKELLTSLGLYKIQQQSFQPKAETQIECRVFFQWLLDSFGTVFLGIPGV